MIENITATRVGPEWGITTASSVMSFITVNGNCMAKIKDSSCVVIVIDDEHGR